jgi:hypothetical protein
MGLNVICSTPPEKRQIVMVPEAQLAEHLTVDTFNHVSNQIHGLLTSAESFDLLDPGACNRMILIG